MHWRVLIDWNDKVVRDIIFYGSDSLYNLLIREGYYVDYDRGIWRWGN